MPVTHRWARTPLQALLLLLVALALVDTAFFHASHPTRWLTVLFADAAAPVSMTDEFVMGGDARQPSLHHTGLREGDFFDSLDELNSPLTGSADAVTRLRRTLYESAEERERREAATREAHFIYTGLNDTRSTITTLSMSSVTTMDGSSSCSATLGCPRSSVAWASGTFTFTELLTPASLSTEANLSLKISLCCDYKFHGALLRDTARYDQFLSFLLQASPFQVLSPDAKAQLFPQHKAFIVNSKTGRAYDHTYELTESDRQSDNDGDGDVLVLFTGRVPPAALDKVAFSSLRSPTTVIGSGGSESREGVQSSLEDASADMQLKVVNTVLKCKCPHTLLVMPLLHMRRDALPPINILGLGPHCGLTPTHTAVPPHRYVTRVLREGITREQAQAVTQQWRREVNVTTTTATPSSLMWRGLDDMVGYATSFLVSPPVLPASEVHWRVTEDGPNGRVMLDHRRLLAAEVDSTGALLLDHAPSPYWMVEPDVRYHVEVTVSRQGVRQTAEGTFVMRLPFYRHWALPSVRPAPHFGFNRMLKLSAEETLVHNEVPYALNAGITPPNTPAHREGGGGGSNNRGGRRSLSYYGYWENTPLSDQLLPQKTINVRHNPFDTAEARFPLFIGKNILAYFVRDVDDVCDPIPLEGRELWAIQGIITTPTPLTACTDSQDISALILRQLLWRMRQERRFLVNVPGTSWTSPEVEEGKEGDYACEVFHASKKPLRSDEKTGAAQRHLCQAIRTLDGGISGTTALLRLPYRDVYRVVWAADLEVDNVSSATAMLIPENIDSEYVTVRVMEAGEASGEDSKQEAASSASRVRVEVRSRPHVVVRRIASYPPYMTVELPMHERRWRVSPPRALASSFNIEGGGGESSGQGDARHQPYRRRDSFGEEDEVPSGYWLARTPLGLRSVSERLEALLDTSEVPNVQRMLPNGTLVFVAQDAGEDLSLSHGLSYLARCPDVPVEVLVSVVAIKAPPITPAYAPVYTEESCVEVKPPRPLRKDEVLEWRVPGCTQASHPPYLVQREVSYDEAALEAAAERARARRALIAETARNQKRRRGWRSLQRHDPEWADDDEDNSEEAEAARTREMVERDDGNDRVSDLVDDELPGVPIPGTRGRRRVVMLACGVEVYAHCDVVWTATNLVGMVTKTYSLRRCQKPPDVVFHVDGLQQDRALPARYFELPSLVERIHEAVLIDTTNAKPNVSRLSLADSALYIASRARSGTWRSPRRVVVGENEYVPYVSPDTDGAEQLRLALRETPHHVLRTVIPIAGYDADVGYSFNFTGPQSYFEAEMTPLVGYAANQLLRTRAHFTFPFDALNYPDANVGALFDDDVDDEIPWLTWRRRTRLEVAIAGEQGMPWQEEDTQYGRGGWSRGGRDDVADPHRRRRRGQEDIYGDDAGYPYDSNNNDNDDYDDYDMEEGDDWHHISSAQSVDDDESFWADLYSGRQQGEVGPDGRHHAVRSPAELYFRRLQREAERRLRAEDARLNREFLLRHHVDRRRLELHRLHNASLYPMDYVVRASRIAPNAAAEADRPEFEKRGMCLEHPGHTSVLVVNPRGAVLEDERYGTSLPPPPPPAVAVLPFCQEQYVFSRHPHLDSIYHFDFTWECEDDAVLHAAKRDRVYSTITHVEAPARNGSRAAHHNATNCRLVVQNHLTETIRADWFLVQRVFPTVLTSTHFVLLGDGAARTVLVRAPPSAATPHARPHTSTGPTHIGGGSSRHAEKAVSLYVRRPNGYDGHARRVVGPSAVVHVDAPSNPNTARWTLHSFIPQLGDPSGTEATTAQVRFTSLFQHPAAVARGRGGSTALVKGLSDPGLYTIGHHLPDPTYPHVCPNVSLIETLDVFRAQVLERELFICGGTATLQAVPIPQDISHEFIGQWEVVALQTAPDEVWTRGINFTGIRFDHGTRDTTLVHGLPFGILTIRWAIYRVYTEDDPDMFETVRGRSGDSSSSSSSHHYGADFELDGFEEYGDEEKIFSRGDSFYDEARGRRQRGHRRERRVLVDYDSMRVVVLTENLFSHRLVTLSSAADVVTTSSTIDWFVRESAEDSFDSHAGSGAGKRRGGAAGWGTSSKSWQDSLDARLGWQPLLNFTGYYPVDDPVLFPYVGAHPPRPGSGLLTMEKVPVGTTELMYTLRPSDNVFGPMLGQTCELRGTFLIERVSAYFTVNTTLDHECDGYTGLAKVSMCLHAEVPPALAKRTSTSKVQRRRSPAADMWRGQVRDGRGSSASGSQEAWAANVQLVPIDAFERVVKTGARQAEEAGCATPWWVWPETQWTDIRSVRREGLPAGRCVRFTVQAGRHLSPREVALPLFLATPGAIDGGRAGGRYAQGGRSVALVDGNGAIIAGSSDGGVPSLSTRARGAHNSSTSRGHRVCAATPDFITSQVIEGAGHLSLEDTSGSRASTASGRPADRGVAGTFIFSRQQKHHRGMLAYLPILDPATLYRRDVAMRPLVGSQGLPDEVTTELNITRGNESIVTLRLDLSEPRLLGGYVSFHDPTAAPVLDSEIGDYDGTGEDDIPHAEHLHSSSNSSSAAGADKATGGSSPGSLQRTRRQSLLRQCVHGHARASDVLQFWTETNRPDGAVGRTAEEWLEYVHAVQDTAVPCEILFPSLEYILSTTEVIGRTGKTRTVATSSTTPNAATALGGSGVVARAGSGGDAVRAPHSSELVPLEIIELQLERIQRAFRVTQDGIDVTGLRPELQVALARRRLTPQQLRELEQARQDLEKEEKARNAKARLELMNAPTLMKRADRILRMMETYRGVTGMEPSAIRIRLPRYEAFTTPYDLLLRTALHKDVVCGTHIAYPPAIPAQQSSPLPNRHSLVTMGRVEIVDTPPMITPPGPLKQCEVEGDLPVLLVNISGAVFSAPYFTADRVEMRELPNPNLAPNRSPAVGLTPCLGALRRGMHAVVGHVSKKLLYLQLTACPAFQMMSSEEYNEYQDSDELLKRLQHPRYLEVLIRDALRPDSFTSRGSHARDVMFVVEVRPTLARLHLHAAELAEAPQHAAPEPRARTASGASAAFVRSVLPWRGGSEGKPYVQRHGGPTFQAASQRVPLMCESDLRQHGFELGIELIGDTWTGPVGTDGEHAIQHDAAEMEAAAQRESAGNAWRPTITARGNGNEPTRRRAPQNTALINSFSIVEHYSLDSTHHLYLKGGGVYRSHFVNYLFSTILANRDVLLYHEFVRRYNDTFVSLEVPAQPGRNVLGLDRLEVWGDVVDDGPERSQDTAAGSSYSRGRGRYDGTLDDLRAQNAWRELPAVRRFSKVEEILFAVPGIATNCHGCLLADTTFFVAGDLTGLWGFLDTRGSSNGLAGSAAPPLSPHHLTAKQLPVFGTPALEPAFLSRPLIIPWDSAERIPQQWHLMWLCPSSAYRSLEQFMQYWRRPVVATAGEGGAYVEASVVIYALRDAMGAELSATQRPTTLLTSEPVPVSRVITQSQQQQPTSTHHTSSVLLASNVRFRMNTSSINAAYTAVAADLLRYRRPQVLASHAFDFHRDGLYTEGLLAVNASVFVRLCVPLPVTFDPERGTSGAASEAKARRTGDFEEVRARPVTGASPDMGEGSHSGTGQRPQRQCMIVSITDTLLTVEAPVVTHPLSKSWLRRFLGTDAARTDKSASPRYASPLKESGTGGDAGRRPWTWATVLHNVLLALLVYLLVPSLGLVDETAGGASARRRTGAAAYGSDVAGSSSTSQSTYRDHGATPARVGLTAMVFILLMFAYARAPTTLWVALWLAIWTATLYVFKAVEAVICFIVSAVYWRLTLEL